MSWLRLDRSYIAGGATPSRRSPSVPRFRRENLKRRPRDNTELIGDFVATTAIGAANDFVAARRHRPVVAELHASAVEPLSAAALLNVGLLT